ncbi:DUF3817 domain-containing protein [Larkinella sp. VNQ87]|uniref:DUF3817 domain-containing protein n=1 Tax=Larkinella sp. VNQ87 TaxID=3400921 RepID=UPI003BFBF231
MQTPLTPRIRRLRLVAVLEGISFLVLIGIAMPLKYIWGQPWLVQNIGLIHGLLFILYILNVIQAKLELDWPNGKTALALVLSVIPFGTFYVTSRLLPQLTDKPHRPDAQSD